MKEIYPWQQKDFVRLQGLRKRPVHAILFRGPQGIGKFDLAINFAQSLLCQHSGSSGLACGKCDSCHWFEQLSHPDFRLVQPDSLSLNDDELESGKKASRQISVDQVRGLSDFFGMSAHQGGRRVVVIRPAEAMNVNAANALLKSLEEPPPGVLFILVSHKAQQLLPTVLSRCLSFPMLGPDVANAVLWLQGRGIRNPLEVLASAGYSPLQAVLQDQLPGRDERVRLLRGLRQPDSLDVFGLADALQKTEQVLVVQWLQQWTYDLSAMKLTGTLRYHPGEEAFIGKLVEPVPTSNLARLQKLLLVAKREAQHTLNPKLFVESLLLTYRQLVVE
jgi:DNA polymerase-3 subunit delta'